MPQLTSSPSNVSNATIKYISADLKPFNWSDCGLQVMRLHLFPQLVNLFSYSELLHEYQNDGIRSSEEGYSCRACRYLQCIADDILYLPFHTWGTAHGYGPSPHCYILCDVDWSNYMNFVGKTHTGTEKALLGADCRCRWWFCHYDSRTAGYASK